MSKVTFHQQDAINMMSVFVDGVEVAEMYFYRGKDGLGNIKVIAWYRRMSDGEDVRRDMPVLYLNDAKRYIKHVLAE